MWFFFFYRIFFLIYLKKIENIFFHTERKVSLCARVYAYRFVFTRTFMCRHRLSCIYTSSLTHSHKSALTFSRSFAPRSKKKIGSLDGLFSSTFFSFHTSFTSIISPLPSSIYSELRYSLCYLIHSENPAKKSHVARTHLFIALVISSSCTVQLSPSSAPFLLFCFTR